MLRVGAATAAAVFVAVALPDASPRHHVRLRNFYGTLQVSELGAADAAYRSLFNGTIKHGVQFIVAGSQPLADDVLRPGIRSGDRASASFADGPMRVGVIGLGTGTLAAYGQTGDVVSASTRSIPAVIDFAQVEFRYLRESAGEDRRSSPGDARLSLERESPQSFDVLVGGCLLRRFDPRASSDGGGVELYFHHLKPTGALAIHVTNKYLDLAPVVERVAKEAGAEALVIHNSSEKSEEDRIFELGDCYEELEAGE